jgi:hypothetical protein
MTLGPFRLQSSRDAPGLDALLEVLSALGRRCVTAEPVRNARELPGRDEIPWIVGEGRGPDLRRTLGTGHVGALCVERVGILVDRDAADLRARAGREQDIE